jgi:glutamate-1-semialdehyde 2,1-aminomutase/spore coat polysaccharide biosynthesis protein SpsF
MDDIDYTLAVYCEVLAMLKDAVKNKTVASQLRGETIKPTFRKTSNFNTKPLKPAASV